ncbi:hypothetical protein DAI22_02g161700 [Oryza sativa Japonica Group]|jgi:hypothetical protein|nr:hypothetical protein DAI22_02g161700 [Oryza sativa Japonica Group]
MLALLLLEHPQYRDTKGDRRTKDRLLYVAYKPFASVLALVFFFPKDKDED